MTKTSIHPPPLFEHTAPLTFTLWECVYTCGGKSSWRGKEPGENSIVQITKYPFVNNKSVKAIQDFQANRTDISYKK